MAGAACGIVCGLAREARCIAPHPDLHVRVAGLARGSAESLARALARGRVRGLVSFGLAGALDPAFEPGTLLLPSHIRAPDGRGFAADADWRARIAARFPEARDGVILGCERVLAASAEKAAAFARTGAAAVDMESHAIAAVAAEWDVPFLAVRAIADAADTALPAAALAGIGPDGTERPLAVLYALLRKPGDLPALLRLARDSARGIATLRRVGRTGALALLV